MSSTMISPASPRRILPFVLPLLLSLPVLLAACGGGSSDSSASQASPSTAAPAATPPSTTTPATSPVAAPASVPVADFNIASQVVATGATGKIFGLKANFFNDGLIPPSPMSNYGFPNPIIPVLNADGSLDVAWLDYSGATQSSVSGLGTPGTISITHVNPDLSAGATTATSLRSYKLLGFTKDASGAFYVAYNVDHPYRNTVAGDVNNVNGNELHIAKASSASFAAKAWDTLVFGNQDNSKDKSKGNPGTAGGGVLSYDAVNQKLVLYVAHQMAWGDNGTRHQAGYFRYFDGVTGSVVAPAGNAMNMGSAWFYSHNFNQRLLIDNGTAYTLAHGDAYPRQLGFSARTLAGYLGKDNTVFDKPYQAVDGAEGDNTTNAETGQFIKLSSGDFAMVHATSQGRAARDVRISLVSGADGSVRSSAWLTSNAANTQAIMPKLEAYGSGFVVSYGLWNSSNRTNRAIEWHFMQLDASLNPLLLSNPVAGIEFVADLPLLRFTAGPNAGRVGWVSGNDSGTLSVNLVPAAH
ncbi:hypothetical protein [Collimonas pratensis]|uniref:Putative lipoprotein n=1 Tax=Collimonas pratensis TaxID=279113 RepID=A0A127Q399_9BURK|nr:hypothetical protein [Collimonas pratensis]AMP04560.1 putative lipoprotein [Collimonas pratensis]